MNREQESVVRKILNGDNHRIIGKAGTGKSFILKEVQKRMFPVCVEIVAPTNTAANHHSNAKTIWKFLGIPIAPTCEEYVRLFAKIFARRGPYSTFVKNIKATQVLAIEEYGSVSAVMFSLLDSAFRYVLDDSRPFGGRQVLAVGDTGQLAPPKEAPCWTAPSWAETFVLPAIELKIVVRQENPLLRDILDNIRGNTVTDEHLAYLESRRQAYAADKVDGKLPHDLLYVVPTRYLEDKLNHEHIEALEGDMHTFEPVVQHKSLVASRKISMPRMAVKVSLKVGAVVCTESGMRGCVTSVERTRIKIQLFSPRTEQTVLLKTMVFKAVPAKKLEEVTVQYMPLRVDRARTANKAQCMTVDHVCVMADGSNFLLNQVYTSISRTAKELWICGNTPSREDMLSRVFPS
jgi:hypothetical protein